VVEIHTVQALPRIHRPVLMEGLAGLVGVNGGILVISHAAAVPVEEAAGPPWAVTVHELRELADEQHLHLASLEEFASGTPPRLRLRALLQRRVPSAHVA